MDQDAVRLAKAIRQKESGGNFYAVGDNGTSKGAYQWQEGTWRSHAQQILGDANARMTPENQNAVAYGMIKTWKDQGLNPAQISAKWNSGSEKNWENKIGFNKKIGVAYNVPKYVKSVTDIYQQMKQQDMASGQIYGAQPSQSSQTAQVLPEEPKKGFFREAAQDIAGGVSGAAKSIVKASDKFNQAMQRYQTGQQGLGSTVFQTIGQVAAGTSGALGELTLGALGAVAPQGLENVTKKAISGVVEPIIKSEPVQDIIQKYEQLKTTNPELAANIDATLGLGSIALDLYGAGAAGKTARTATTKAVQGVATGAEKVGGAIGKMGTFGIAKLSGMQPENLKFIIDNPKLYKEAVSSGLTREGIAKDIADAIDNKIATASETGSGYEAIKKSLEKATVSPYYVDNLIKETGFDIKKGKIVSNTLSPTRDAAQIKQLQNFLNNWSGKTEFTPEEFLNMRKDLSDLSSFDKSNLAKIRVDEKIARSMREKLNSTLRKQFKGLEQLDSTYAPQISEANALKKEFFTFDQVNQELVFKPSAVNKIYNATGKGKQQLLDKLENLSPGITEKIRISKALEDIENIKGRTPGTYLQAGTVIAGVASGNVPLAVLGLISANPTYLVNALVWSGINIRKAKEILSKIVSGETLNDVESAVIKDYIDTIKGMNIKEALDTLVGVGAIEQTQNEITNQVDQISQGDQSILQ